jgi:hypothetical protein
MSSNDVLIYLVLWSLIGAFLFSLFVLFVYRSGVVYISRKQDGTLKEEIPLRGYLVSFGFLLAIVGFLFLANYLGLARKSIRLGFMDLMLLNLALYLVLFLFDTLFIDAFVLGYWRPAFLQLPEETGLDSMRVHILKSIPVGTLFGILIAVLSTAISFFTLMS